MCIIGTKAAARTSVGYTQERQFFAAMQSFKSYVCNNKSKNENLINFVIIKRLTLGI